MLLADDDVERHMKEADLQVRRDHARLRGGEQRRLGQVLTTWLDRAHRLGDQSDQDVVVEVVAHSWDVRHKRDVKLAELLAITDAGQQQQLR